MNTSSMVITPRDTRSMQSHLSEICGKQYDVLSIDEEVELATRSRQGDTEARNKLVEHNLRLAITIAKSYQNQGVDIEDLIVAAETGLIAAAEHFDPTVGVKFISYACHYIRREITDMLTNESRTIRLPQNIVSKTRLLRQIITRYQVEHNSLPDDEEIAERMDISVDEAHTLRCQIPGSMSMETPLGDDSDSTIGSLLSDETAASDSTLMRESLREELRQAMSRLSERDRMIVWRNFGLEDGNAISIDQLADELGLSRERVRQIRETALHKIRSIYRTRQQRA